MGGCGRRVSGSRLHGAALAACFVLAGGLGVPAAWEPVRPRADLALSIDVAPLRVPASRLAALAIMLGIDFPSHTESASGRRLAASVAVLDARGESVAQNEQIVTLPPGIVSASGTLREGLVLRLDVPPGRYEIRASVRDEASGVRGMVARTVDVPDFVGEALTLSGVLLQRNTPVDITGGPLGSLIPFTPTVERAFRPAERVLAHVRVYQGGDDMMRPVQVTARIVGPEGRTVLHEGIELPADWFGQPQVADYQLALPLDRLDPGAYLLTIEATLRDVRRSRAVRFEVRA